jgi:serine/threonine-protein kinase RsbW
MGSEAALVIDSRLTEIARARQWLRHQARAAGFTEREVRDLELVLSEACTNVIKHAYHGQPDYPIALRLAIDETKLVLVIRDIGTKFDLSAYTPPDLDQPQERGYGVFIIRSLMDEVHYDTTGEQGTTLTLVKYRSRPTA